ncbi:MAG: hypothetical protein ABSA41_17015 [Terriglobia bacterium]|jgi:hypothetical protein
MKTLYAILISVSIAACCLVDEWRIHRPDSTRISGTQVSGAQVSAPPPGHMLDQPTCGDIFDRLRQDQAAADESLLADSIKALGDYNRLVGQHNRLLADYNKLAAQYDQLLAKHRSVLVGSKLLIDEYRQRLSEPTTAAPVYIIQPGYAQAPEPQRQTVDVYHHYEPESEPSTYTPAFQETVPSVTWPQIRVEEPSAYDRYMLNNSLSSPCGSVAFPRLCQQTYGQPYNDPSYEGRNPYAGRNPYGNRNVYGDRNPFGGRK